MTAIDKALELLDILAAAGRPLGLTEVVTASGQPKPTARRLLVGLLNQSFVMQNAQGKYELGNAPVDLAARALGQTTLAEESRSVLAGLRHNVTGTITLSRFSDHELSTVSQIDASSSAFLVAPTSAAPLHASAAGKAILAYLPRADVERIVSEQMRAVTTQNFPSFDHLKQELEVVRDRGFAIEDEEAQPGVRAVAVPVRTFVHRPIGAVAVASAAKLVSTPELIRMAPHVIAAADAISSRLGGDSAVGTRGTRA